MEVFENLVTLSLSLSDQIRSFCRSKLGTDRRGGEGRPQPPAPSASATPTQIPTLRCATPSSLPLHMSAHNDARGSVHNVAVKVFIMMQWGVELLDWLMSLQFYYGS